MTKIVTSKLRERYNSVKFFASQCNPLSNTSILSPLTIRTYKRLSPLKLNEDDSFSYKTPEFKQSTWLGQTIY